MKALLTLHIDLLKVLTVVLVGWYLFRLAKIWVLPDEEITSRMTRAARTVIATLLVVLAVAAIGFLSGCKPKPKPVASPASPVVRPDTHRQHLERQLETSSNQVTRIQKKAKQTVTDYEDALKRFDADSAIVLP
ncbi:hypothetical protein DYU11_21005 [Fibrisoma montanum]|uniref:Uncharacterized protein n=1 Tax=Fibrisoma montanum TaxID=2305895 RepID=A0A418M3Y8_9BACT|nr:hypothetical protein [Fibrisoma montanum]RIV20527.1 hypothetical protein DYU11_21005 [Fibrisoma montanum]